MKNLNERKNCKNGVFGPRGKIQGEMPGKKQVNVLSSSFLCLKINFVQLHC